MMMIIKLTHANDSQEILVAGPLLVSAKFSDADKCTHVMFTGGAMIPVKENKDEIMSKIEDYYDWKAEHEAKFHANKPIRKKEK